MVLIDWLKDFDDHLTRLEESSDPTDQQRLRLLLAELTILQNLDQPPTDDTPSLKRVRQSRRHANPAATRSGASHTPTETESPSDGSCGFPPPIAS